MIDSLTKFRLRYIDALAKSWRDEDYKKTLLDSDNVLDLFENSDGDELDSFINTWPNVKVKVVDKDDHKVVWAPTFLGGWIGAGDLFIIKIPQIPKNKSERAQAIANYAKLFPTFLGRDRGNAPSDSGVIDDEFLRFGAMTLQVITILWKAKELLDEGAENKSDSDRQLLSEFYDEFINSDVDAAEVLSKYFSFNNPWNFKVKFVVDNDFSYEDGEWKYIPKNEVILYYPQVPSNEDDHPIALTTYNSNYNVYPFTCC